MGQGGEATARAHHIDIEGESADICSDLGESCIEPDSSSMVDRALGRRLHLQTQFRGAVIEEAPTTTGIGCLKTQALERYRQSGHSGCKSATGGVQQGR